MSDLTPRLMPSSTSPPVNPDHALILRCLAGAPSPLKVDSNPLAIALGLRLIEFDAEQGRIVLDCEPDRLFVQGASVLQGGAITTILDFAMAFAVLATLPAGQSCATLALNTAFLRAAPQGHYLAVGKVERRGHTVAFASAQLFQGDTPEICVATASSTLAIVTQMLNR